MLLGSTLIDDTFAEAFRMRYARVIITALDEHWVQAAARECTGYGSSIIACDAEAGVERWLTPSETPDGRPGASLLFFGFANDPLAGALLKRIGQCVMTCPSTAVFDGLPAAADRAPLGKSLRYFGDGFQKSKVIAERRYWRIPVMDGEFFCCDDVGLDKGVAGGNIVIQADTLAQTLNAIRRAVESLADMPDVITPFPGGAARSGSKVGSRYKALRASTADAFCPTLRGRVESKLHPQANHACEIVIDGTNETVVGQAMAVAIRAAVAPEVLSISAGNYGGKLGKFQYHLHQVLS